MCRVSIWHRLADKERLHYFLRSFDEHPMQKLNQINGMAKQNKKYLQITLVSVICACNTTTHKYEWQVQELDRKNKVGTLFERILDEQHEEQRLLYIEFRDVFLRKRDISFLTKKIDQHPEKNTKIAFSETLQFVTRHWRLPQSGWTSDLAELHKSYSEEFDTLGCISVVSEAGESPGKAIELEILDFPAEEKNRRDAINLILTLEPQSLRLWGAWKDISFLGYLVDLEKIALIETEVNDFSPLQGLPQLKQVNLVNGEVADLSSLGGLSNLKVLSIEKLPISCLAPIKGFAELRELHLIKTGILDLSSIKDLQSLKVLNLRDTKVADLTPLKGLRNLQTLHIENTQVTDLEPLRGLSRLKYLYVTDGIDLEPLKEHSVFIVRKENANQNKNSN